MTPFSTTIRPVHLIIIDVFLQVKKIPSLRKLSHDSISLRNLTPWSQQINPNQLRNKSLDTKP